MNTLVARVVAAGLAIAASACGAGPATAPTPAPAPAAAVAPAQAQAAAPAEAAAPAASYTPGGMWMPEQLLAKADTLKSMGLEIDPAALANPLAAPLGAVVSLGGCSASFVSPQGLIATNYHCVRGSLQYHSTPEANYLRDGFLAKTAGDEKSNGPTARVYVTQKITDVTGQVLGALDAGDTGKARYEKLETARKSLVAACEKDRADTRCRVASYFEGSKFYQIESLMIRDVRLVYAPAAGIGEFGGDIDNWMWPRHTGDYAFYRAYVNGDGKPADYSVGNVPYEPPHHLRVATAPLREGDFVMVAGYPGRTYRHRTAHEVRTAVDWTYPWVLDYYGTVGRLLQEIANDDKEAAIKVASRIAGINNYLKNTRGMLDGLVKGGLADTKEALESDLKAWIGANPDLTARYGSLFADMQKLAEDSRQYRESDRSYRELNSVSLLRVAQTIVKMAEERPKPDADRDPTFQERNWKRMVARMQSMNRSYSRRADQAMLRLALERAKANPDASAAWKSKVIGRAAITDRRIERTISRLYGKTRLENAEARVALLQNATVASLKKSRDPFIRLALSLRDLDREIEARSEAQSGTLNALKVQYMEALRRFSPNDLAPDANSTLRVTYGTVRGYRPTPNDELYAPFTTLSQVVSKHRGEAPFDVPAPLRAAVAKGDPGPYVAQDIGDVPVNFLSDLDITGGNSGSATLNGRGELVGLAFDGNYEAMASDWLFMDDVTRTIHVDIRYVLWIMDAVDGAERLMEEMGVRPALD